MSVRFIPLSVKLEAAVSKDTRAGSNLCAPVLFPTTCTSHVLFEPLHTKEACEESSQASGIPSPRVSQSRDSRKCELVMRKLDFMNSNRSFRHDVKISENAILTVCYVQREVASSAAHLHGEAGRIGRRGAQNDNAVQDRPRHITAACASAVHRKPRPAQPHLNRQHHLSPSNDKELEIDE